MMFARNVLLAFALCATSTVFAAPISVSTTISSVSSPFALSVTTILTRKSSATITSNTQLLSSTTIPAETPSATANEHYAWGSRDVDDERMPVVRPSAPRSLINIGSPSVEPVDRGAKQLDQMHKALDQMHKQLDEMHRQMNKGVWQPDHGVETDQRPGNAAGHVDNGAGPPALNKGLAFSPLGPLAQQPEEEEPDHIEPPPPGAPGEQHDPDWYDDEKRDVVPGLLAETDLEGVVSETGLGEALDNLSPDQLLSLLSKLSPEQLRTLLSNDAIASLLSKADLEKVLGAAPATSSADEEAAAASAVASALASS